MSYRDTSGLVPYQNKPDLAKQAARAAGKMKFSGSKCVNGHSGIRYVKSGQCVDCIPYYRALKKEKRT